MSIRYSPALLGPVDTIPVYFDTAIYYANIQPYFSTTEKTFLQRTVNNGSILASDDIDAVNTDWIDCKLYTQVIITLENHIGDYYVLFWANGESVPNDANDSICTEFLSPALEGTGNAIVRSHDVKSRWLSILLISPNHTGRLSYNPKNISNKIKDVHISSASAHVCPQPNAGAAFYTNLVDSEAQPLLTSTDISGGQPLLSVNPATITGQSIGATVASPLTYRQLTADSCHNVILLVNTLNWEIIYNNQLGRYTRSIPLDGSYALTGYIFSMPFRTLEVTNAYVFSSNSWTPIYNFDHLLKVGVILNFVQGGTYVEAVNGRLLTFTKDIIFNNLEIISGRTTYIENKVAFKTDSIIPLPLNNICYDVVPQIKNYLQGKSNLYLLSLDNRQDLIKAEDIQGHIQNFINTGVYAPVTLNTLLNNLSTNPNAKDNASIIMFGSEFNTPLTSSAQNYINNSNIATYVVSYDTIVTDAQKSSLIKSSSVDNDTSLHYIQLTANTVDATPVYRSIDSSLTAILARVQYSGKTALMTALKNVTGQPVASHIDTSLDGACMFTALHDNSGNAIGSSKAVNNNALYTTPYNEKGVISPTNPIFVSSNGTEPGSRYIVDRELTYSKSSQLINIFDNSMLHDKFQSFFVRKINLVNMSDKKVWVRFYNIHNADITKPEYMYTYIKLNICLAPGDIRDLTFKFPLTFLYGMHVLLNNSPSYITQSTEDINNVYLTATYELKDSTFISPAITDKFITPEVTASSLAGTNIYKFSVDITNDVVSATPLYLLSGWILYDRLDQQMTYRIISVSGGQYTVPTQTTIDIKTYIINPGNTNTYLIVDNQSQQVNNFLPFPAFLDIKYTNNIGANKNPANLLLYSNDCIFYTNINIVNAPALYKNCTIWSTVGSANVNQAWNSFNSRGGFTNVGLSSVVFVIESKYNNQTGTRVITFASTNPLKSWNSVISQVDYYSSATASPQTNSVELGEIIIDTDSKLIKITTEPGVSFTDQRFTIIGMDGSTATTIIFSDISPYKQTQQYISKTDMLAYFGGLPAGLTNRLVYSDVYASYRLVSQTDRLFNFSTNDIRGNIYFYSVTGAYYVNMLYARIPVQNIQFIDASGNWDNIQHTNGNVTAYRFNTITPLYVRIRTSDTWCAENPAHALNVSNFNTSNLLPDLLPLKKNNSYSWNADPGWTNMTFVYSILYAGTLLELPIHSIKGTVSIFLSNSTGTTQIITNRNFPTFNVPVGQNTFLVYGDFKKLGNVLSTLPLSIDNLTTVHNINNNCTNLVNAFKNAIRLTDVTDINKGPTYINPVVDSLKNVFLGCTLFNGSSIENWNTANVTDLESAFSFTNFSSINLSQWNVAKVRNMNSTFEGTKSYIGNGLNNWNVTASLESLVSTFSSCRSFNVSLSSWNVSNVKDMSRAFLACTTFTGTGLNNWHTDNLTNLTQTFYGCVSLNVNLGSWNVSKVTSFDTTFRNCYSFTATGLEAWRPGTATTQSINMNSMFSNCRLFNVDISGWEIKNVNNMTNMFTMTSISSPKFCSILKGWSMQPSIPVGINLGQLTRYNLPVVKIPAKGSVDISIMYHKLIDPVPAGYAWIINADITADFGGETY